MRRWKRCGGRRVVRPGSHLRFSPLTGYPPKTAFEGEAPVGWAPPLRPAHTRHPVEREFPFGDSRPPLPWDPGVGRVEEE